MVIYQRTNGRATVSRATIGTSIDLKEAPSTNTSATGKSSLTVMKTTRKPTKALKRLGKLMTLTCPIG